MDGVQSVLQLSKKKMDDVTAEIAQLAEASENMGIYLDPTKNKSKIEIFYRGLCWYELWKRQSEPKEKKVLDYVNNLITFRNLLKMLEPFSQKFLIHLMQTFRKKFLAMLAFGWPS